MTLVGNRLLIAAAPGLAVLAAALVGCSTSVTFDAPYGQVLKAVDAEFGPRQGYSVSKEPRGDRRCVYNIRATERDGWQSFSSSGPAIIDVRVIDPARTKVSVQVMREGSIAADRDEQREREIVGQIRNRLNESVGAKESKGEQERRGEFDW